MTENPYEPSLDTTQGQRGWTLRRVVILLVGCLFLVPVITIACTITSMVATVWLLGDEVGYMQNTDIPAGVMVVASLVSGFGSIVMVLALSRKFG